MLKPAAKFSCL